MKTAKKHSGTLLLMLWQQAIQHLYPEAKFGIGPALENGWYYDIGGVKTILTPDQVLLLSKLR